MSKWFTGFLSFADELKMNTNTRNNQWALDTEIEAGKVSIRREESISHQISPETSPAKPASCKAVPQPAIEISLGKVTVPIAAPRFPEPFINPRRIPGPRRVISITVAQNAGAATNCKPAAVEKMTAEAVLLWMTGAMIQQTPEAEMASSGTIRRPQGLPHFVTLKSHRMPPTSAPAAPAR